VDLGLSNPIVKYDQYGLYDDTVDSYCKRYPKGCRDLFPNREVPIPPPVLPTETDDFTETTEQPDNPEKYKCPPPENDPCVIACIKCFTDAGKWYEKIYSCPLCVGCIAFGGV